MSKKKDKFKELAEKRVTRLIKDIRLIGNLSNTRNYEYESEDVKKIFLAIDKEIKLIKVRFEGDSDDAIKFRL